MKLLLSSLLLSLILGCGSGAAAQYKVLVVMSYEEDNPWVREIREGIDSVLKQSCDITYFHMNTKANRDGGPEKAREAFALFQRLKPHGVIAADDDAQSMFVVPYLKDKTATPVMFNGVNADVKQYGYPNAHISGTLERAHVRESLSFIKQIVPSIQTVCFMTNDVPPGQALRAQVEGEKSSYPVNIEAFHLVKSNGEFEVLASTLRGSCDALFIDSLEGIVDASGKAQVNREVLKTLTRIFNGPILAGNRYQVEQGAWAAVIKTGQEQGELAAGMLLQAMGGKTIGALPVTRNSRGQRIINVTALERHGIVPKPTVLRGAMLVKEQP